MKQTVYTIARLLVLILLAGAVLSGCASMDSADEVMEEIAWDLSDQVSEKPELLSGRTLSVYYFTENGKKSGISDYLIDTLTSKIAMIMSEENLDLKVVSRQALDRIMKEMEFQLSALADESTQISLGKQLGADIILTGTILPVENDFRINAQLIEVESGVVLNSYMYEFWKD